MILMDNSECKVIKSVSVSYLDEAKNESPYNFELPLVDLESNMTVNKLKQKRKVSNPAKNSHKSKTTSRLKEMFLT